MRLESEKIVDQLQKMGLTPKEMMQAKDLAESWIVKATSECPFPRVITAAAFITLTMCNSTDGLNERFKAD